MPKSLMFSGLEGRKILWEGRLCSGVDRYGFFGLIIIILLTFASP